MFEKFAEYWQLIWEKLYQLIFKLTEGKYGYEDGSYPYPED